LKPIFVEKVCSGDKIEHEYSTEVIKSSICSKETSRTLRYLLEAVVTDGTAKRGFKGAPYTVAGKTGTAQRRYWERKKGEKQEYGASFVGYFPADNPTYSCIVVISNPKRNGFYGSQAALPVFRKISDRLYSTSPSLRKTIATEKVHESMSLKSGSTVDLQTVAEQLAFPTSTKNAEGYWAKSSYKNKLITGKKLKVKTKGVPNVKSLSMKDALYILENAGLRVIVKGSGRVIKQSLLPGEKVIKGKTIELTLA
jgi:cell division protein FtsI (penicillin-binding protein 3)